MEAVRVSGLTTLGPIGVRTGAVVRAVGEGIPARLLALMAAIPNRHVSTDHLVEALWGHDPPSDPRASLQVQVHRLRRVLGQEADDRKPPALLTEQGGYRLVVDEETLDSLEFEHLLSVAADHAAAGRWDRAGAALEQALDRWRGEPFGGLGPDLGLDVEVTRLAERRLDAEERLSIAQLEGGEGIEIARLRRLVDESPLRERRWGHLMLGLYRCGRQADALRVFREAAAHLDRELGLVPGPELCEIEERILLHDPRLIGSADHPGSPLPSFPDRLIGREAELKELVQWMERHRVVTLIGLGGIGKTRLAVAATEAASRSFSDGVAFVDLSRIEGEEGLHEAFKEQLVPRSWQSDSGSPASVIHALRDRHLLLVVDNAEEVVGAVRSLVDSLIAHSPRLHVLLTSRIPTQVSGEHLWPVAPLELPGDATGELDETTGAVELFVEAVRRFRPGFELGMDDFGHAVAICRLTGGIPLAVELAAAAARMMPLERLTSRLEEDPLWIEPRTENREGIRSVLKWTLDTLGPESRTALAALSVFRGGWTMEAAEAVLEDCGASPRAVASLVDASLVSFDESSNRYGMLEPVRAAAADGQATVLETATLGHARYFVRLAESALPDLNGVGQTEWYARFEADHDNYRVLLERGIQRADPSVLGCLPSLGLFWFRRSFAAEGARWFDRLEDVFDFLAEGAPLAALQAAHTAMWSGDPRKAEARLDRLEPFAAAAGIPPLLGRVLHSRGNNAAWGRGTPAASLDFFRAAFEVLAPTLDPLAVVSALSEAYMAIRSGDFERARARLPEIEKASEVNEVFGAMGIDQVMGLLALYEGNAEEADRLLSRSLRQLDQMGLTTLKGPVLVPLVWAAVFEGRLDEARRRATDAYHFVATDNGGWRIGETCAALGAVELAAGNRPSAQGWFTRGFASSWRVPEVDLLIWNAVGLLETAEWPDPGTVPAVAAAIRRVAIDHTLATPAGAERLFTTVRSVEPAAESVDPKALKPMMREVLVGRHD